MRGEYPDSMTQSEFDHLNLDERDQDREDEDDDFDDQDEVEDGFQFDDCGMTPDGGCQLAGTEECDFECPYRDDFEKEQP